MADTVDVVAFPSFAQAGDPPDWVVYRGQDVRGYDSDAARLVFGPSHPFRSPNHCHLTNGLIRCRAGAQGASARVNVEVFVGGAWVAMPDLYFNTTGSTTETIQRARLQRITPDVGTMVLEVRRAGPIHITIKRGERMLRVAHGSPLEPKESRSRRVMWNIAHSGAAFLDGLLFNPADGNGILLGVAVTQTGFAQTGTDLGLSKTAEVIEVAAFAATAAANDTPSDHQDQFAGIGEQALRLR